jgi:hypothetical protein
MASTSFKLFLLILSCEALIKIFPAPEFPGTDLNVIFIYLLLSANSHEKKFLKEKSI